ncbi:hypothetical protein PPYR_10828 [Photinus pyralis]|uniref:15-hydroxyprostaglandin dehydrogenase n=1 Tax=Photinus pyralis TaxID=7054 RepID=A0A1Y1N8U2_PHOPY|nr:15-hydroxyprostaglandin dehydrogenase [NAD(+)]-like [Photinus pyralis]KAB0796767.1 hypothetical protein PPYR_10828 [Photinus pyralis]
MNAIYGKVALISGGAAGIGLHYAKELLRNGLRAVTLADVSEERGKHAVEELTKEFGGSRSLFVKTDVTDKEQFAEAFERTVDTFKNIDMLVNNAGIMNDAVWERQIGINFVGTIIGCILALHHYLPKYKTANEGIIVNVASTTGLEVFGAIPVYVATKHAVVGLTQSWGTESHYKRTQVRFLALCPGPTDTTLALDGLDKNLGPAYQDIFRESQPFVTLQGPEYVAKGLLHAIEHGENGSIWVVEDSEVPYEVVIPSREKLKIINYHDSELM